MLKNRIKTIEKQRGTNKLFVIPLFQPFTLDELYRMIDCWGINRKQKGEVIFIDGGNDGYLESVDYDPRNLAELKAKLNKYNEKYPC